MNISQIYPFFESIFTFLASQPFEWLFVAVYGSFAVVALLSLFICLSVKRAGNTSRVPFLWVTNLYTATALALFTLNQSASFGMVMAILLWIVGYVLYGILRLIKRKAPPEEPTKRYITQMPATPPLDAFRSDIPAAGLDVRLDHALSITERLLAKNMGKGDRQEVEKIRSTLSMLQMKGFLSTAEGEILNENFNTLLKLMAKYNV
jgi:hypothetical protein